MEKGYTEDGTMLYNIPIWNDFVSPHKLDIPFFGTVLRTGGTGAAMRISVVLVTFLVFTICLLVFPNRVLSLDSPTLISLGTGSEPGGSVTILTPTFSWNSVSGANYYGLYVSKFPYGSGNIVFDSEVDYCPIYGTPMLTGENRLDTHDPASLNQRHTMLQNF